MSPVVVSENTGKSDDYGNDAEYSVAATHCPVCGGDRVHYSFSLPTVRVVQCSDCSFSFCAETRCVTSTKGTTSLESSARLQSVISKMLEKVAEGLAINISSVELARWDVDGTVRLTQWQHDPAKSLTDRVNDRPHQRVILSIGQLESSSDPIKSLRLLHAQVNEADVIVFVFSDVRHLGAKIGTREWEQLIDERAAYLDCQTAIKVLFRGGFRAKAALRLQHKSNEPLLRNSKNTLVSSEVAIVATRRESKEPVLSVIIPVFDEAATVKTVIDSVLGINLEGAQIELIVVESNSRDGSRKIVEEYASHPRVTCIFEDSPQGKGHGIREGLRHASGDVLIIQDADLEYDFEDYHSLVDPILRGREAFILGSRHGGRNHWKLRRFTKPLLAKVYNIAHVLVTAYINLLFGLRLRDPQTMFKVFRRDCIEGIEFSGNYFNFDYELLLKIVRKGYRPTEIPVNYRSRSHAEGKKIRMWRDAPLGLWTITKLRFTPLSTFLVFGDAVE